MAKYQLGAWDLKGLVTNPKSPTFEKQILEVEKRSKQFEKIKLKLNPKISSKKFLGILQDLEVLDEKISVIGGMPTVMSIVDKTITPAPGTAGVPIEAKSEVMIITNMDIILNSIAKSCAKKKTAIT